MPDVDEIVANRLKLLADYVDHLHDLRDRASSFEVYQADMILRRATERTLQIAVEACLDIGRRLINVEGFRYAQDDQDVFQILREEQVVPANLLPRLIEMARFRNLVVHDYAKIDDAKVYAILKRNLGDFDEHARAIADYIAADADSGGA